MEEVKAQNAVSVPTQTNLGGIHAVGAYALSNGFSRTTTGWTAECQLRGPEEIVKCRQRSNRIEEKELCILAKSHCSEPATPHDTHQRSANGPPGVESQRETAPRERQRRYRVLSRRDPQQTRRAELSQS
ncbi:unnamed protein product [Leptosia nina]|uniref:Uncharacterized protein n=1 Tax=Leptosia nina TaxID=320188 RepID=A0AAV1JI46_9NEOP